MKAKHLFLAITALLAAGGLWLARSAWRTPAFHKSSMGAGFEKPRGTVSAIGGDTVSAKSSRGAGLETPPELLKPGHLLRPPVPNRRFTDFTPEQRVQFTRQGHGPGG